MSSGTDSWEFLLRDPSTGDRGSASSEDLTFGLVQRSRRVTALYTLETDSLPKNLAIQPVNKAVLMKTRTIPHSEFSGRQRIARRLTGLIVASALVLGTAGLMGNTFVTDMGSNVKGIFTGEFFNAPTINVENRHEQATSTADGYANLTSIDRKPTVGRERLYYHKGNK